MRTAVSRLLLVLLLGVAVVTAVQLGAGRSDAAAAFEDLNPERLRHTALQLNAPARLAIDAGGSYEESGTEASDTTMAAYGWIVRRADGAVVWRMHPPRPSRGTFVSVRDTVDLGEGTYDVYFASYGDPLVRDAGPRGGSLAERLRAVLSAGGRSWRGDASRWRLIVEEVAPGDAVAEVEDGAEDPADEVAAAEDAALVWAARGVSNGERREHLFQVHAPTRLRVRSTTEVTEGAVRDVGSIVRLGQSDTVWTFRPENATWAGGALKNRQLDEEVALEPGLYRAAFEADRSHAYDDWEANPPFAPWRWGMEVSRAGADDAVTSLDPADLDLPQIAGFTCVGSNEEVEEVFTLARPTDVLLVAAGEIIGGSRYDYGGLDRREASGADEFEADWDDDRWEEVWEMEHENTVPAGGSSKNRRAVAARSLEPGTYRLRYETDGSHDCGDGYNSDAPDDALWGIVLYALDPTFDPGEVEVQAQAPPLPETDLLVRIDSVGNDEQRTAAFTLNDDASVRVVAVGEMSESERFDWAEIADASGDTVWEMTWDATEPAGGDPLNRRFDDLLDLPAGTYIVRYQTGDRHAFGSPGVPGPWGVRVYAPADE